MSEDEPRKLYAVYRYGPSGSADLQEAVVVKETPGYIYLRGWGLAFGSRRIRRDEACWTAKEAWTRFLAKTLAAIRVMAANLAEIQDQAEAARRAIEALQ